MAEVGLVARVIANYGSFRFAVAEGHRSIRNGRGAAGHTEGVVIYEQADYEGASAWLTADVANLWAFEGPCLRDSPAPGTEDVDVFDWNDCVSSIPGGTRLARDDVCRLEL